MFIVSVGQGTLRFVPWLVEQRGRGRHKATSRSTEDWSTIQMLSQESIYCSRRFGAKRDANLQSVPMSPGVTNAGSVGPPA